MPKYLSRGFTLVELLIVIAIIAILATVVVLVVNPLELLRRGRDSTRLQDLSNLNRAITAALEEATGSGVTCNYPGGISGTCGAIISAPSLGRSNIASRLSNGTGWVKVDLVDQIAVNVPVLPVDPNNTSYHYSYCGVWDMTSEKWELDTTLESTQYSSKLTTDGGNSPSRYEVGSNLTIMGDGIHCLY